MANSRISCKMSKAVPFTVGVVLFCGLVLYHMEKDGRTRGVWNEHTQEHKWNQISRFGGSFASRIHKAEQKHGLNYLLFYNAIPKTGCRSVTLAANRMKVIPERNLTIYTMPVEQGDNETFVRESIRRAHPPALLGGHTLFPDFAPLENIIYVNIVRDPIERLISHYYFSIYGDETNISMATKKDHLSLDECLQTAECFQGTYQHLRSITLRQFCGMHRKCRKPTLWSFNKAMENMEKYLMIGITEDMDNTIYLLEKLLPDLLHGLYDSYKQIENESRRLFATSKKPTPTTETLRILRKDLDLEYHLYHSAKNRFEELKLHFRIL